MKLSAFNELRCVQFGLFNVHVGGLTPLNPNPRAFEAEVVAGVRSAEVALTGRLNWRHGARVVLGCFILFGASSIAAGIQALAFGGADTVPPPAMPPDPPSFPIVAAPPPRATPAASADPFAGAALPSR